MKTKIKLQRHEFQAYYYMLLNTIKKLSSDKISEYIIAFEINKMAQNSVLILIHNVNKKQFTVTLNDYQTVCLLISLTKYEEYLEPLERSIALRIIETINQQFIIDKQLINIYYDIEFHKNNFNIIK